MTQAHRWSIIRISKISSNDHKDGKTMSLDSYWKLYDHTLATVRAERPSTFAGLKTILDRFEPPSSGEAFFPGGADDTLALALMSAGWSVDFEEGDYLWTAAHPVSGAVVQHVEGDVYCLKEGSVPVRITP